VTVSGHWIGDPPRMGSLLLHADQLVYRYNVTGTVRTQNFRSAPGKWN
jgi:hypothetical protein